MSSPHVLVTGSTGFLGFVVLLKTLQAGYHVRAAVRSIEKAKTKLLATPSLSSSPDLTSRLTFIEVPDITVPGAYTSAIKDIDYVIHVASPITSAKVTDYQTELTEPALQGTLEVLRAALPSTTVKRIVITSSVVANAFKNGKPVDSNAQVRTTPATAPYGNIWEAYRASKNIALNASEEFVREHKPKWDLISIQPGYILGANELATTRDELETGTATSSFKAYIGKAAPLLTGSVHVQDVAFVHVAALDEKIQGNRSFGVNSTVDWNEAWGAIEKNFPKEVEQGVFKKAEVENLRFVWDASETEEAFAFKFKPLAESTRDTVSQWLALPA